MRRTATRWRILACFACLVAAGAAAQQGATAAAGTGAAGAAGGDAQPSAAPSAEEPREEELISLTVTDANIQDVLRSLGAMRPRTNVLMGPEVTGTVSFVLRDVTWDIAMKLITESHGFQITQEGNLFRVHKPAPEPEAVEEPDIIVELLTATDVEALSDEQIKKLLGPAPLARPRTPEEARQMLQAAPDAYVKRLSVDNQSAVEVVTELAKKADLNYAFTPAVTPPRRRLRPRKRPPRRRARPERRPPRSNSHPSSHPRRQSR